MQDVQDMQDKQDMHREAVASPEGSCPLWKKKRLLSDQMGKGGPGKFAVKGQRPILHSNREEKLQY